MAQDNDYKKKIIIDTDESDDSGSGESGKGGKSGQIEFKEFIGGERLRDDLLTGDEKRRLLTVHEMAHETAVKQQRATREQRKALKEGKISLNAYREGVSAGKQSEYKSHPVLSDKAQFSGIDRQVNALPNENVAETNQDLRNELQYKYNLVHRPENAPRFNPKPLMNR